MTDSALANGVVRVTIEAESMEVAQQAARALGNTWKTTGPTDPAPMPGEDHYQVRMYAMPPTG